MMHINGYNPYKKGFDMLVADIREHEEGKCITPSASEPFTKGKQVDSKQKDIEIGVLTVHGIPAERYVSSLEAEIRRLNKIEDAAVAAVDFDQWQGDEWYERMIALQKALADSTEAVCQNCDGTGDVTNQIGEYLGRCNCGAPSMFQAELSRIDEELKGSGMMARPVAWVRFCSDGCYEGPIMDARMEEVRKQSGAWTPLYTHNGLK